MFKNFEWAVTWMTDMFLFLYVACHFIEQNMRNNPTLKKEW